jgi:hypothetical protein
MRVKRHGKNERNKKIRKTTASYSSDRGLIARIYKEIKKIKYQQNK